MKAIGEIMEQNIIVDLDPVAAAGFTQVPNFILKDHQLSIGAKITYAMFLSYAWNNNRCFPGQERVAEDIGMSRPAVTAFIGELERNGFLSIQRRGLGKTNLYTLSYQVKKRISTSRRQPADIKKSEARLLSIE